MAEEKEKVVTIELTSEERERFVESIRAMMWTLEFEGVGGDCKEFERILNIIETA